MHCRFSRRVCWKRGESAANAEGMVAFDINCVLVRCALPLFRRCRCARFLRGFRRRSAESLRALRDEGTGDSSSSSHGLVQSPFGAASFGDPA